MCAGVHLRWHGYLRYGSHLRWFDLRWPVLVSGYRHLCGHQHLSRISNMRRYCHVCQRANLPQ